MNHNSKRNAANILLILGLAPALLWLSLLAVSSAMSPWVTAGVIWFGVLLCFLSLLISGSAWVWAHSLTKTSPEIWQGAHRAPRWIAAGVAGLVICAVFAITVQGLSAATELPTRSVQLSREENEKIIQQVESKIEELTAKPVAPPPPTR